MLAFIEFFIQIWFINKYARKKKAKILESHSFLVRYRRTYVLNNNQMKMSENFIFKFLLKNLT